MTTAAILAGLGLILSAYFSGSEIAVIRAEPLQLQVWTLQKKHGASYAYDMFMDREHFMTVILVGNNLANILATTFATLLLTDYAGLNGFEVILCVSAAILVFGEVIPKSLVRQRPNSYLLFSAGFMRLTNILLNPVSKFFERISSWMVALFRSDQTPATAMIYRDEIEQSIYNSYHFIPMDKTRKRYLNNILEFSDTTAGEIITPRTDMIAASEEVTPDELKELFIVSGFSKILIYRDSIDQIIGFVSLRDIFGNINDISGMIRPIEYYPESKSIIDILKEFQNHKISIAVILDEYGGTAGMVTMEDIIEEIFGEFDDEYDDNQQHVKKLANGDLMTSGRTETDYLVNEYGLTIPDGDYETIAGFLLQYLNRFPQPGEILKIFNAEYTILKSTAKSIDHIKIKKLTQVD